MEPQRLRIRLIDYTTVARANRHSSRAASPYIPYSLESSTCMIQQSIKFTTIETRFLLSLQQGPCYIAPLMIRRQERSKFSQTESERQYLLIIVKSNSDFFIIGTILNLFCCL